MSEERDIVERLNDLGGDDHIRLECPARYAECTCGYTHRMEAITPEAASEITRLRGEVERLTAEREGWGDIQGGDPNEARGLLSSAPKPGEG